MKVDRWGFYNAVAERLERHRKRAGGDGVGFQFHWPEGAPRESERRRQVDWWSQQSSKHPASKHPDKDELPISP